MLAPNWTPQSPFTEGRLGVNNKASPPGRHQEQAPKQRCTFSSTTFSSVQFSTICTSHRGRHDYESLQGAHIKKRTHADWHADADADCHVHTVTHKVCDNGFVCTVHLAVSTTALYAIATTQGQKQVSRAFTGPKKLCEEPPPPQKNPPRSVRFGSVRFRAYPKSRASFLPLVFSVRAWGGA